MSWPLGYILIAKGKSLLFALTELAAGAVNVGLMFLCMKLWKLEGTGVSFTLLYVFHTAMMVVVAWRLTGFCWSATAVNILWPAVCVLGAIFGCTRFLPGSWGVIIGLVATAVVGVVSLLAVQKVLGVNLWRTVRRKFQSETG